MIIIIKLKLKVIDNTHYEKMLLSCIAHLSLLLYPFPLYYLLYVFIPLSTIF